VTLADRDKKSPVFETEEDGWDEAIEEWDKALDAFHEPDPSPPAAKAAKAARAAKAAHVARPTLKPDKLVEFVSDSGEIELPEDDGEALGTLLGSAPAEEPTPVKPVKISAFVEDAPDIGLSPDQVTAAETEIELGSAAPVEEPTPVRAAKAPARPTKPAVAAKPAVKIAKIAKPAARTAQPVAAKPRAPAGQEGFDLGPLLETLEKPEKPESSAAAPRPRPRRLSAPMERVAPAEVSKAPPPLDLFDELVPPVEPEPSEDEIVAGDVLTQAAPPVVESPPSELPLHLAAEDLKEPAREPPPIPDELARVDLGAVELPDRGQPIAPPRSYWERLAERLQLEANLTDSSGRAAALEFTVARAFEELGETDEALDHYREVLNHRTGHVPALRALRRLFTQRHEMDQVAELLSQTAERVGPEERRALLATRAELLWSRTGDDAGARLVLDDLAARDAGDLRTLLIRADLASATQDDEELLAVLVALADLLTDQRAAAALQVEVGRAREILGQADGAATAYRKAAAADERCAAAHEGLIRVASSQQDAAGLRAALAAGNVQGGLWGARRRRRRATLALHHKLPDVDPLAELARAAELAPDDPLVLEEIAEVRRAAGDAAGAIEAYRALVRVDRDPQQTTQALVEAALLAEDVLKDPARALELYAEAESATPGYPPVEAGVAAIVGATPDLMQRVEALRRTAGQLKGPARAAVHLQAATLLEQIPRVDDASQELLYCLEHDPSCHVVLSRLERIFRTRGAIDRLAATFDTAAEATTDAATANNLCERAALLYEGLGKHDIALRRYRQILQSEPERSFARWGVIRNLARLGFNDDLAEELSLEASAATNAQWSARVWSRCGNLLAAANRQGEAEAGFRMAVSKVGDQLQAGWALIVSAAAHEHWSEVSDRWTAMLDALPAGSPQRKAYQLRLAALQERELDEPAEALASYEAAGGAPGGTLGVLRLLGRLGREEQLTRELEREADTATDPAERFALLVAAGELAARSGAEVEAAAARLIAAQQLRPHALGRQALEQLFISNESWPALASLIRADLDQSTTTGARVQVHERLAALALRRGDEEEGRASLEAIIELTPSHLPALRWLQRHHFAAGGWPFFGVLRREAEAASPADSASLWLELGRLIAHRPLEGDGGGSPLANAAAGLTAHDTLRRAFELRPGSLLVLRSLLDAARAAEDKSELARIYLQLAEAIGAPRDAAIYLTRAGELLGEADFASFKRALERLPDHLGAIYNLRDNAIRVGDWSSAAMAAEAEGAASRVVDHVVFAYLLAGEIARQHLNDPERAMQAYQSALEADPADRLAFERLREHLERNARWTELATLLFARSEVERSRSRLVELHRSLAAVAKDRLDDRAQAKRELRMLLGLQPEDLEALSTLADLCALDAEWPETADALIRMARLEKSPIALRDLFLRLGRIYQDETPDPKRAIASFNKVVTLDPANIEALSRLSDLYLKTFDFKRALATTQQLHEKDPSPERKVDHMLRIAKIHEDGLKDSFQASVSYRGALDAAPSDLRAIGELCGFFARQGDQRSLMVHLDRSVATMRARLKHDPFETFAYQALFKIFGWRKAPDGSFCTAQILDCLGQAGPEEREFLETHRAGVGAPGSALADPEHDEWLFVRSVPGGFRQVFQLLAEPFTKLFPGDIRTHGASRADRVNSIDHPMRRIGDVLARDLGVNAYELYILRSNPTLLVVENTVPPAILIGSALCEDATEDEILFLMGRCLWMVRKAMILPSRLRPEDLEILVGGVVRQYSADFQPSDADLKALQEATRQVNRAIPKKLRQELMGFALECSGPTVELRTLGGAIVHTANRAGLLACRSIHAAMTSLRRIAGKLRTPQTPADRALSLRGNEEAEELLRFAVSDAHFELRRAMHVGIR
jgi:tetratricopeptide (TPR) repeat protein